MRSESEWMEWAILIRVFEQRLLTLFSEGKLFGTVHTCIGQEWSAVAVVKELKPCDAVFSNHRGHGHYLARTDDVDGLLAEIMGRESGVCKGRGGSQHLCKDGFFSNGIQGGMTAVAAGYAFAKKAGSENPIAVVFVGDGTFGEGLVYETLNIISKWDIPLLFVLEDNKYAQSTSQQETLAGTFEGRAKAFDISYFKASTEDITTLCAVAEEAVGFVRQQRKPAFLHVETYRLMAHSKGDDTRDPLTVKEYWLKDPLAQFEKQHPDLYKAYTEKAEARLQQAFLRAESTAYCSSLSVVQHAHVPSGAWRVHEDTCSEERFSARIFAALHEAMKRDPHILLLGEDIESPYGGAFKVTKNLSETYPGRVRNMPISESLIVGLGNGLALAGQRPVCEIMFGDFCTLIMDQLLNHAVKFSYMYGDQIHVPLVVRTPMGGRRGYGPTHSQSLEKHLLGIGGLDVFALNHRYDPYTFYADLLNSVKSPTLVVENKMLYGVRMNLPVPKGFVYLRNEDLFPVLHLKPIAASRTDAVLLCYGGLLEDAERAVEILFDQHDMICEIICPLRLSPSGTQAIADCLKPNTCALTVEEGQVDMGWGERMLGQLQSRYPGLIQTSRSLGAPPHPLPCCAVAEKEVLPHVRTIVDAVLQLKEVSK